MTRKGWIVAVVIFAALAAGVFYGGSRLAGGKGVFSRAEQNSPQVVFDRGLPSLSGLVRDTKEIVVNISTTTVVKRLDVPNRFRNFREFFDDDAYDRFSGEVPSREYRQRSLGSGFVIDKDGYILTNNHVVEKASSIKVRFCDGKEYRAKVVGRDAKTDIALIKVGTKQSLPVAMIGDSDKLEVGDWVMAIGNPYGLDHTVTAGIVSAKGRIIGQGPYDDYIQTDASINPGNSGGPLFNLRGEVVGINTAIVSGGQGIGFAIPVNMAKALLPQLRSKGKVVRGWLGVVIQKVTPELARSFGLKGSEGALVSDIVEDSPAARADIRRGDIIVSFDEKPIKDMEQLPRVVSATATGRRVRVGLVREGRRIDVDVTVAEAEEEPNEVRGPEADTTQFFGLVVQNITPDIARRLGLKDRKGVIVTDMQQGSPADDAEIRTGDIIKEINRKVITNLSEFKGVLKQVKPTEGVVMLVRRDNLSFYAVVRENKDNQ
jgi:serine protease Do